MPTIALLLFATGASAKTLHCTQTSISASGFSSLEAAQSWFPKNFVMQIDGDKVNSDPYGLGTVETSKGRKKIVFVLASSTNIRTELKVTFIEKTSKYTARLGGKAGYTQTPGARGKCKVSS